VARLGGDEFVAIQCGAIGKAEAEAFASRIADALSKPIRFKEQEIVATASIGVAMAPADGRDPDERRSGALQGQGRWPQLHALLPAGNGHRACRPPQA
jgi:GGDEF domain-containing protein